MKKNNIAKLIENSLNLSETSNGADPGRLNASTKNMVDAAKTKDLQVKQVALRNSNIVAKEVIQNGKAERDSKQADDLVSGKKDPVTGQTITEEESNAEKNLERQIAIKNDNIKRINAQKEKQVDNIKQQVERLRQQKDLINDSQKQQQEITNESKVLGDPTDDKKALVVDPENKETKSIVSIENETKDEEE